MSNSVAKELSATTFEKWWDYIRPSETEAAYMRQSFFTTLWEAVVRANREHKPILLWAMNGHPMACT
jgi:hypothetical protein